MAEMLSAYLIAGTDTAKIEATRTRLRSRAEAEGGLAALEVFEATEGKGMPDINAVLSSIPALSLTSSRRYILVDGFDRWRSTEVKKISAAITTLPPDLTVVLISHRSDDEPWKQKKQKDQLQQEVQMAVKKAKGDVLIFNAPKVGNMPRLIVEESKNRGFTLDLDAARILVFRMGTDSMRLGNELDRLALWAGDQGRVAADDLLEMVADESETVVWELGNAILDRDAVHALDLAERLFERGERPGKLLYGLALSIRRAQMAAELLESGVSQRQVENQLPMKNSDAADLVARLGRVSVDDLRDATIALADLEVWTRGGADYGDELAFTLALRRAAGATI